MQFQYISYTKKIWWLSVWLSPIIWGLTILIEEGDIHPTEFGEIVAIYLIVLIVGLVVSLPAYGLFILANEWIFQNTTDIIIGKIIASFTGFIITYLLFEVFLEIMGSSTFGNEMFNLTMPYFFTVFFGTWRFEPFPKP